MRLEALFHPRWVAVVGAQETAAASSPRSVADPNVIPGRAEGVNPE
jgi:hypothetical protein